MLKGVRAYLNPKKIQVQMYRLFSGFRKYVCANLIPKYPGIDFCSGLRKNGQGGGGANRNPNKNPGIYFYSGLRKNVQGGGVKFEILNIIQA